VVDGPLTELNCLLLAHVEAVHRIQDAVCKRGPGTDREQVMLQACAITVDVVQIGSLSSHQRKQPSTHRISDQERSRRDKSTIKAKMRSAQQIYGEKHTRLSQPATMVPCLANVNILTHIHTTNLTYTRSVLHQTSFSHQVNVVGCCKFAGAVRVPWTDPGPCTDTLCC
jgi:hypothetical protein